jgi:ribonuclease P protein component
LDDQNRVKKRRDFTRVYQKGKSVAAKDMVLCYRKNGLSDFRVGFTVSKKVGNAVTRNHVRRRLKEIARLHPDFFMLGYDYVIVAKHTITQISYREMEKEVENLSRKIKK